MKERIRLKLKEWGGCDLPESLSDQDYEFLKTISDQGRIQMISGPRKNTYRVQAKSWVGSLRSKGFDLVIEPKIPLKVVYGISAYVAGIRDSLKDTKNLGILGEAESLPEMIALVFLRKFSQWIRVERQQSYHSIRNNSPVLRGRFLWRDDLRQNWPVRKGVMCEFSTRTHDSPAHRVILAARNQLARQLGLMDRDLCELAELRARLRETLEWFPEKRPQGCWQLELKRARAEPLTPLYREMLSLAEMILKNSSLDQGGSIQHSIDLVDMNRLFEDYVRVILSETAVKFGYQVSRKNQIRSYLCRDSQGVERYEELPDIGILRDGQLCHLLDAKYKSYDGAHPDKEDVRQLFLYLYSFREFGIQRADLVYPGIEEKSPLIFSEGRQIGFAPLNLSGGWGQLSTQSQAWAEKIFRSLNPPYFPFLGSDSSDSSERNCSESCLPISSKSSSAPKISIRPGS